MRVVGDPRAHLGDATPHAQPHARIRGTCATLATILAAWKWGEGLWEAGGRTELRSLACLLRAYERSGAKRGESELANSPRGRQLGAVRGAGPRQEPPDAREQERPSCSL